MASLFDGADEAAALEAARLRYRIIADELARVGIDVNCAPLLDVRAPEGHEIIGSRALGQAADEVARRGRAVCEGLLAGGVLPVIKHIPGHGRATVDSHLDLPRVATPRPELERIDFAPFRALADQALGMTAHVVYEAIDPDRCATLSPAVIDAIRRQIGFDGLLMTDDLSMRALAGPMAGAGAGRACGGMRRRPPLQWRHGRDGRHRLGRARGWPARPRAAPRGPRRRGGDPTPPTSRRRPHAIAS